MYIYLGSRDQIEEVENKFMIFFPPPFNLLFLTHTVRPIVVDKLRGFLVFVSLFQSRYEEVFAQCL